MALLSKDRVKETTTTTGTGALTLVGAVTGFRSFAAIGDGNTAYCCCYAVDSDGIPTGQWETFVGTYTASGTTLARTTLIDSSTGSTVNFSSGAKHVIVCFPASASAQRTALGLGSAATGNTGDFAAASHTHAQSDVTNLVSDLADKAPLASPTLTGTPAAPSPSASDDSTRIATTAMVQAAIANAVAGLLDLKGSTNASTNPNYPSALKGDVYLISAAGKVGGASGKTVEVCDFIVATADNAGGNEASVGTSWAVWQANLVGALLAANNLSDISSASTARTNLGLGSISTQAASSVAITGGNIDAAVIGNTTHVQAQAYRPVNTQTGTGYTLVLSDRGKAVMLNNSQPVTITIPPNSSVAFTTGTEIDLVQLGAGTVTVVGDSGVTLYSLASKVALSGQYAAATLKKLGTDVWLLVGGLA